MSSSGQNATRASILRDQIAEAATRSRSLVLKDSLSDPSASEALDTIVAGIVSVADRDKDYDAVKDSIQQRIQDIEKYRDFLDEMLKQIESLKTSRISQLEHYGEEWWQQRQKSLAEAFQRDQPEGVAQWLQTYAEALIAWELHVCRKLVEWLASFHSEAASLHDIFQRGTQSIEEDDYEQALGMLLYLIQARRANSSQTYLLDETSRATLHVFIGRIYLYQVEQDDKATENKDALEHFTKAQELNPQDGLPSAALGNYHHFYNKKEQARALYQQAIDLSATQPDGYIGIGLLLEDEELWDEADDWYEQAIKAVQGEKNIIAALSKMLAPVSGNVYLQMARMFKEEEPERALLAVTQAIGEGIKEKGDYPERIGYKLKGKILEQLSKKTEAAEAYYEAGRRFAWENDTQTAIELLGKAKELNPQRVSIYWALSEALRISSYLSESPYVNEEAIKKSLVVWDAGAEIELPAVGESWAYLGRASINEQLIRLPGSNRWELKWEAIAYIERAILLESDEPDRWAYLSFFHRRVRLESNALYDTAKALEQDSNHLAALDEQATNFANVGEFARALEVSEHRKSIEAITWVDGLKSYVLLRTGKYQEALELLNKVIEAEPKELWYRESRGLCYQLLDDPVRAAQDYGWIWDHYDPKNIEYLTTYGWAAYNLGQLDQAIEIFKQTLNDLAEEGNIYRNLGLFYLAKGEAVQGEEFLNKGIELAKNTRELDDLLKIDFKELIKFSSEQPHAAQVRSVLDRVRERAVKRRAEVEHPPSPEEEMKAMLDSGRTAEPHSCMRLSIQCGLARLYTDQGRSREAVEIYRALQSLPDPFPQARAGLEKVINRVQGEGDRTLKEGGPDKALKQFSDALQLASELLADDPAGLADLHARRGYTFSLLKDSANARASFTKALELYREDRGIDPGEALGETCLSLVQDAAQGQALDNELKSFEEESQADQRLRTEIAAARRVLAGSLQKPDQLEE